MEKEEMILCPICGTENPPRRPRCKRCGTKLIGPGASVPPPAPEGAAPASSAPPPPTAPWEAAPAAASEFGMTTSLLDQLGDLEESPPDAPAFAGVALSSAEGATGGGELDLGVAATMEPLGGAGGSSGAIIATPPLPPLPPRPRIVEAFPADPGLLGLIRYGLDAPERVAEQREQLQLIGDQLVAIKRGEKAMVAVLGRAARMRGLIPSSARDLVVAAEDQLQRSLRELDRVSEKELEKGEVERAVMASRADAAGKLDRLTQQQASLVERLRSARSRLEELEAQIQQLGAQEEELKRPPRRGLTEEETEARVREYEAVKAQRKIAEIEAVTADEQVRAAAKPLGQIEVEITILRTALRGAEERLSAAEGEAKAAVVSSERRQAKALRTVEEIEEDIGRAILNGTNRHPALAQLIRASHLSAQRVDEWQGWLNRQQEELDRYDAWRARRGYGLVLGATLVVCALILGGGELISGVIAS